MGITPPEESSPPLFLSRLAEPASNSPHETDRLKIYCCGAATAATPAM
jgi:hypothetical protein